MSTTHSYLFSGKQAPLGVAFDRISRFRNLKAAHDEFIGSIVASLVASGSGGITLVGCSPAVRQDLVVSDVLKELSGGAVGASGEYPATIQVSAPPQTLNGREQLNVLRERYRTEANRLVTEDDFAKIWAKNIASTFSSATDSLSDVLSRHDIKLVIITHGDNLIDDAAQVALRARAFRHLADVAQDSGVSHLVFGVRSKLLEVAQEFRPRSLKIALQPLYDPTDDEGKVQFLELLTHYDLNVLSACSAISLRSRSAELMARVGGDPSRLAEWLAAAICFAAGAGAEKLDWCHLQAAGPSADDEKAANADLTHFVAWKMRPPLTLLAGEPAVPKVKWNRRPGRNPSRDVVPIGMAA